MIVKTKPVSHCSLRDVEKIAITPEKNRRNINPIHDRGGGAKKP